MECVDERIQLIRQFPHMFPAALGDIRRAVIRRFPYSIFYLPVTDAIVVLSVFHSSRKPSGGFVQVSLPSNLSPAPASGILHL
jgi:hypothetical protein